MVCNRRLCFEDSLPKFTAGYVSVLCPFSVLLEPTPDDRFSFSGNISILQIAILCVLEKCSDDITIKLTETADLGKLIWRYQKMTI